MKPIKIPKLLHEVFGEESTLLEMGLTLAFAVLSTWLLSRQRWGHRQFDLFDQPLLPSASPAAIGIYRHPCSA